MKHSVFEIELSNGAKGLLVDVQDATVMAMELSFRAGDFRTPKGKWETAHIVEHMAMGATSTYPTSRQYRAELQKNGAYSNASTSPYNLNYMLECADFEWERILELVKHGVEDPIFTEQEFQAEKGNVREELVGDLNHNFRQIIIKARKEFGLVALPDPDRIEQLDNITVEDIRDYYAKTHLAGNLRFLVAGNVKARQKQIEKIFESIELGEGERVDMPDETPQAYKDVFYIEKPDLQNVYFFFNTFAQRDFNEEEDDAMNLVNVMLTTTIHSRILGEARERGLAYHMSSSFNKLKGSTGWWFGAELTPKNCEPVFEIIVRELQRLQDGILDDEDLEAAKQFSLGKYQRSAQTVGGLLNGYSGGYFFDGRIEDYHGYPDRIKGIQKEKVIEVIQSLFADKTWGLTIMGTEQKPLADALNEQLAVLWK